MWAGYFSIALTLPLSRLRARSVVEIGTSNEETNTMSREDDLMRQLADSPETEILGVVAPGGVSGVGGGPSGDQIQWTLLITLSGWKPSGGEFRDSEMTVRKLVQEPEIRNYMAAMNSYDVVRLRARWSEINAMNSTQALLIEFLGKDTSSIELNAHSLKLQESVTFEDGLFGTFTLNRRVDWYEAAPTWCGNVIGLSIPSKSQDEIEKSLQVARCLWADQTEWQRKISMFAIKELLELKNGTWLSEGEEELTAEEFSRRMTLESITIESDGSFEFWHDDGDLFWGHSIMVSGDIASGIKEAGIHG